MDQISKATNTTSTLLYIAFYWIIIVSIIESDFILPYLNIELSSQTKRSIVEISAVLGIFYVFIVAHYWQKREYLKKKAGIKKHKSDKGFYKKLMNMLNSFGDD